LTLLLITRIWILIKSNNVFVCEKSRSSVNQTRPPKRKKAAQRIMAPALCRTRCSGGTLLAEGEIKQGAVGELVRRIIIHLTGAISLLLSAQQL
jgi:hypothetical protein